MLSSLSQYGAPAETGHGPQRTASRWSRFSNWLAVCAPDWPLPVYAVALFYLVLPILLSLLYIRLLSALPHGFVNFEMLVIGAAGVFLPRTAVFLLLALDALADCAYSVCYTYQFSVSDLLESLRFVSVLPRSRLIAGCVVVTAAMLICAALALVRPQRKHRLHTAGALLALTAILLPIDILDGQNSLWHKDVSFFSIRVARSPLLTLGVRALQADRTEFAARRAENEPMASASAQMDSALGAFAGGARAPDVVLVVVESWGLPLDPSLARALTAPYASAAIAHSYRVTYGTAPFTGLTVPGEARELCHSTMGFGIMDISAEAARQCLPDELDARGYESFALHGYVGEMFYRDSWYRGLGFDHAWFGPDLRQAGLPRCGGAFPGVCDGAIAKFIGSSLLDSSQRRPRFIYWVTLNSHLPVPARPQLSADNSCAATPALSGSAALCSWFRLVRAVHQSVSQVAAQRARPTVFILVGDHAPPFADPRLRSQFSASQVPYVMLTPASLPPR
ncbi:MAG: sulfatase-like hydrolase/transferase [Terracidiphilus sp.]